MRMPFPRSGRRLWPATGVLCLLLAVSGCASKNPPIGNSSAAAATSTAADTGVHTTRQRRFLGIFSPYRPDIQQGNFVSREMVAQLKEGMTPEQVRFVLGTPLLTDIFHADRWDYPFRLVKGNGEVTTSRVTVYFKDNRLVRVDGGELPTEADYLARIEGAKRPSGSNAAPAPQTPPSTAKQPR